MRHPYPECASFADTDLHRGLFFGRKREAEALLSNLLTADVVLLFGRSGYGKTSLINAGLMEPLRRQHCFPVVCELTHAKQEQPLEFVRSRFLKAAEAPDVEVEVSGEQRSLWEFFHRARFSAKGHRLRPVLILDQFERLFSRAAGEPRWHERFIEELSDLIRRRVPEDLKAIYLEELERLPVESDERQRMVDSLYGTGGPDVKVLIAIREAFLPELESLRPQLPAIFSNAVRLEPLTAEAAREAITGPAARAALVGMEPFEFEAGALDEMIAYLSLDQRTRRPRSGACIEPAQLQILCYQLSVRRLRSGVKTISARAVGGNHGMQRIMRQFYYRLLRAFPRLRLGWSARGGWPSLTNFLLFHRPRQMIRKMCEYELITASGYRNSVILDAIQRRYGVSTGDLDELVNLRLLRAELRLGTVFYELMHDTLVEPLRKIRRNRRLRRVGMALVLILLLGVIPWAIVARDSYRQFATLKSAQSGASRRTSALSTLISRYEVKDFAGLNLEGVRLDSRSLRGTDLHGARLIDAEFNNVDLRNANLRDTLAQGAQFRNSRLEGADVTGMRSEGARFEGTDWWMAVGWTDAQLDVLSQLHRVEQFILSDRFRDTQRELQRVVEDSSGARKAQALGDLARYRATRSLDLFAAAHEIEEAIRIGDPANRHRHLDTRAYLRIRMGGPAHHNLAVDDLREALRLVSGAPHPDEGMLQYHLGLAREGLQQLAPAGAAIAKAEKLGYRPSYERLLTPRLSRRVTSAPLSPAQILRELED